MAEQSELGAKRKAEEEGGVQAEDAGNAGEEEVKKDVETEGVKNEEQQVKRQKIEGENGGEGNGDVGENKAEAAAAAAAAAAAVVTRNPKIDIKLGPKQFTELNAMVNYFKNLLGGQTVDQDLNEVRQHGHALIHPSFSRRICICPNVRITHILHPCLCSMPSLSLSLSHPVCVCISFTYM